MSTNPGTHTFYAVQHRTTSESPWLKPKGKLKKVEPSAWAFSGDYFNAAINPTIAGGGERKPKYPTSNKEWWDVWQKTGQHGWWTLRLACAACTRLEAMDKEGKFDSFDGYGVHCAAVRHEFRVVKVERSYKVTDLSS